MRVANERNCGYVHGESAPLGVASTLANNYDKIYVRQDLNAVNLMKIIRPEREK
jgi:hypothetical protein